MYTYLIPPSFYDHRHIKSHKKCYKSRHGVLKLIPMLKEANYISFALGVRTQKVQMVADSNCIVHEEKYEKKIPTLAKYVVSNTFQTEHLLQRI